MSDPTETLSADVPTEVGRYRIDAEIGRGGLGMVLRGYDPDFRRPVAVKVLLPRHQGPREACRRFLDEAQALARLEHPCVPPVHEIGRLPDGRPFVTMRLIQGQSLPNLLAARTDPSEDLPRFLATFGQACAAVAYAHCRGL